MSFIYHRWKDAKVRRIFEVCLFPVINLDEIPDILNSYLKNFSLSSGYNLLTTGPFFSI